MKQKRLTITILLSFCCSVAASVVAQQLQPPPTPANTTDVPPGASQVPPQAQVPPRVPRVSSQISLPAASQAPPQTEMSTHQQSQIQGTNAEGGVQTTVVDVGGNLKVVPKTYQPAPTSSTSQTTTVTTTPTTTVTTTPGMSQTAPNRAQTRRPSRVPLTGPRQVMPATDSTNAPPTPVQ